MAGVQSIRREAKHFANMTTMHGPRRLHKSSKLFSKIFWIFVILICAAFLLYQNLQLLLMYISRPTLSQAEKKRSAWPTG
ncbi:unnamed protein product [Caenorhabditis angaria]|uniref:Uncharacterized protein n=1 Tax=Caenorhabditis angaria TaxID=860376 RepID=A0A9P1I728_9PELO|nr:unnamed protein product [Caenorhabditis angaria]